MIGNITNRNVDVIYKRYWIHNKKSNIYICIDSFQHTCLCSNTVFHYWLKMYLYHRGYFYPAGKRRIGESSALNWDFNSKPQAACVSKQSAMASGPDISFTRFIPFSHRWVPILSSRNLLVPGSSGVCSAQTFQQRFVQYTHWFGSERKYSVSILFLSSIQMYIKTPATTVSCMNKANRNWSGMTGDSLRVTPDVAMCQVWSITERTTSNQNIFQDYWESKWIYGWKGRNQQFRSIRGGFFQESNRFCVRDGHCWTEQQKQ